MAITRYNDGNVTVTLDDGLERFVRNALDAADAETVRVMEAAAQEVADKAKPEWYAPGTGVTKRTGASGDIAVVTTVTPDEVRVSVGSTDTRVVKDKATGQTKPRALLIHRPKALSTISVECSRAEWWASLPADTKTRLHAAGKKKAGVAGGKKKGAGKFALVPTKEVPNPKASDGKYLVPELVRKPMRARIRVLTPEIGRAIAARLNRGG